MKTALKISAVILALSGNAVALAQSAVDGSKLPGIWDCVVPMPVTASGSTTVIHARATYNANGTALHEDRIIQTAQGGQPVEVSLVGLSDWRFSKENNQLYETPKKISFNFDKTNPQTALMGVQMDKKYQAVLGKQQASTVVRLDDKEWSSLMANDSFAVICKRGK